MYFTGLALSRVHIKPTSLLHFLALILIKKSIENQTRKRQILSSKVINKYLSIMKTRPACQNVVYFYALTWLMPKLYNPSIIKHKWDVSFLLTGRLVSQGSNKIFCILLKYPTFESTYIG